CKTLHHFPFSPDWRIWDNVRRTIMTRYRCDSGLRRAPALFLSAGIALSCAAGPLQLVSLTDSTQMPPAGGCGDSYLLILSPDGRYVLFASTANNLASNSSNPIPALIPPRLNVFLRDRASNTTALASVDLAGAAGGNGDSWPAAISTNGLFAL